MKPAFKFATTALSVFISLTCGSTTEPVDLVLTAAGGDFSLGDVTVHIPANAVTVQHNVRISQASGAPSSSRLVGSAINVTITPADSLLQPATVEVRYGSWTIPARISRASMRVFHGEGGKWVSLGGTNNTGTSTVTAQTRHFSDFGLLGLRAETIQAQSPTSQTGTANAAVASPPSVRILDSTGTPLEGVPVSFAVTAGGGTISPATQNTNASGIATATSWSTGASAGTNTATATVAELSTTFTATTSGGPPPAAVAWFSDWHTEQGATTNALRDGGKWTGELCNKPVASVVAATGLGFPSDMANVFRSEYNNSPGSGNCRMVQAANQWPAPNVGQSIYYRIYYRSAVSNGADLGQSHPLQATNIAWEWKIKTPSAGTTVLEWIFPVQAYPDLHFDATLNTNQTYRLEWRLNRLTSATCNVELRVYNSSNALVFDNNSFRTENFNGSNIPLAVRNPVLACDDPADFRSIDLGNNDPNTTIGPGEYVYWGGAAVSLADWIGPYLSTRG